MMEEMDGFEVDRTLAAMQTRYTVTATGTVRFPDGFLQGSGMGHDAVASPTLNKLTWELAGLPMRDSRTVGMRLMYAHVDTEAGAYPAIVSFKRLGAVQLHLDVVDIGDGSGDWTLQLWRGSTLLDESGVMAAGVHHHVELAATLDPVDGAYELRIGEQVEFSGSGVNTAATGGVGCDSISHKIDVDASSPTTSVCVVDDVVYSDDFEFHGDLVIVGSLPEGPGDSTGWTPSAGENWADVDDVDVEDADSTYVRLASGATGTDLYDMQAPRYAAGDPVALRIGVVARLEAAGVAHLKPRFGTGSGSTLDFTSTSYAQKAVVMEQNPETATGWRYADAVDGQVGVERT